MRAENFRQFHSTPAGWFTILTALLILFLAHAANALAAEAAPGSIEFFEKKVRPILMEHCAGCHGAASKPLMGNLRVDSRAGLLHGGGRGPAITPGLPDASLLLKAVGYADHTLQMPPSGKLSDDQIAVLADWVKQGAPWPDERNVPVKAPAGRIFDIKARAKHWAWQPIRAQSVPAVRHTAWPRSPIDNFVLAKLEAKGLSPAAPADKRTLLRRVTYDLTGLPPTPEEIHAFLADRSPDAYKKVVDRLLASPHYGERWGRHWLDLVRYAETDGHEWDIEKTNAWQYRDYVIRALNADVDYRQFVTEHIAGDLLPHPRLNPTQRFNESVLGTGFFWLGAGKHSPVDLKDDEAERVDNQIDVLGKAFLGIGLGCARCHDHKFDAVSTRDYYALYGFLKCTRLQLAPVGPPVPEETLHELATINQSIQKALIENAADAFADTTPSAHPTWSDRVEQARLQDVSAFLYPWAALSGDAARAPETFIRERDAVRERLREQAKRADQQTKAVQWMDGFGTKVVNRGWAFTGDAFGSGPAALPEARLEAGDRPPAVAAVFDADAANSGRLSDRLQGTLRSQTFTIAKPRILYHMAGKNARVRLIIEGYQRIRDPLYSGLAIEVDSPTQTTWYSQNVGDWIGHRAYIEIVDDGDGYIAVDKIGFGDGDRPEQAPNPLVLRMLNDPALTSLGALQHGYESLLRETLQLAQSGRLDSAPDAAARKAALCWSLETTPIAPHCVTALKALLDRRKSLEAPIVSPTPALAAADGTGEDERVHLRGNYRTPGPMAQRRFLEACDWNSQREPAEGSGRLQLAQRMTAPSDPLLARVIVNRLWQHHFGEGIVRTPDDFGVMGRPPTHPELLDWLASEFMREGWSLKKMHRLMVLSAAYQMDSRPDARAEAADPQNKLLHRMPLRRLEAEAIRDAILAVSGRLNPQLYGPPIMPNLTAFTPGRGAPTSGPVDGAGRRSIYLGVRRNFLIPMFLAFDYPVPASTMGRRTVSNVPAQALTLLNNPFVVEQAGVWAKRILSRPDGPEQRIDAMYETAFGRLPTPTERADSLAFLTEQSRLYGGVNDPRAWSDLCHVLFNVKEFIFVR